VNDEEMPGVGLTFSSSLTLKIGKLEFYNIGPFWAKKKKFYKISCRRLWDTKKLSPTVAKIQKQGQKKKELIQEMRQFDRVVTIQ